MCLIMKTRSKGKNGKVKDTVDPAFWFGEIYEELKDRVGKTSVETPDMPQESDDYKEGGNGTNS